MHDESSTPFQMNSDLISNSNDKQIIFLQLAHIFHNKRLQTQFEFLEIDSRISPMRTSKYLEMWFVKLEFVSAKD